MISPHCIEKAGKISDRVNDVCLQLLAGTDVGAVADILPDDGSAGFKVSDWSSPDSWAIAFRSMTEKATCWSSMSEVSSSRAAAFNPKRVAAEVVALIAQDNH